MIGESGSGKTTLLNRYRITDNALWKTCRIRARSESAKRPVLPLNKLDNHPAYIMQDARDPIIMIDDVHTLSRTDLESLLRDTLTPGRSPKVKRLVLFGEPSLLTKFSAVSETVTGETAVNKILDDFVAACHPRRCTVEGIFNVRGGITTKVEARYEAN